MTYEVLLYGHVMHTLIFSNILFHLLEYSFWYMCLNCIWLSLVYFFKGICLFFLCNFYSAVFSEDCDVTLLTAALQPYFMSSEKLANTKSKSNIISLIVSFLVTDDISPSPVLELELADTAHPVCGVIDIIELVQHTLKSFTWTSVDVLLVPSALLWVGNE